MERSIETQIDNIKLKKEDYILLETCLGFGNKFLKNHKKDENCKCLDVDDAILH